MPRVALLIVCVIWGSTFFSQQIGVRAIGESPAAAALLLLFRFGAALLLFPLFVPRCLRSLRLPELRDGILVSLPFYATLTLQLYGLQTTSPTISALLTNLTILFVPILGVVWFRERVGLPLLLGAAVSGVGILILTNPRAGGFGAGEAFTLLSAVTASLQIQLTNLVTNRSSPVGVTFVMFAVSTVLSLGLLLVLPSGPDLLLGAAVHLRNPSVLWPVLYNALFASVVCILLMNLYQRRVSPTRAAVIYLTEPVFAAIFAVLFVGEPMTLPKIAGGSVILAGNLLCEILARRGSGGPTSGPDGRSTSNGGEP